MSILLPNRSFFMFKCLSHSSRPNLTLLRALTTSGQAFTPKVNTASLTTSDGRDFYEVLDVNPDATQTEIREAFYRFDCIF